MQEIIDLCTRRGLVIVAIGQDPIDPGATPGFITGAVVAHDQEKSELVSWSWSGGAGVEFSVFWGHYYRVIGGQFREARAEAMQDFARKLGMRS